MGVASGCGEQEVGVATMCGFKEIYRFLHTTYPYSSCICTFLQQHPYFFVHFLKVFRSYIYIPEKCTSQLVQLVEMQALWGEP